MCAFKKISLAILIFAASSICGFYPLQARELGSSRSNSPSAKEFTESFKGSSIETMLNGALMASKPKDGKWSVKRTSHGLELENASHNSDFLTYPIPFIVFPGDLYATPTTNTSIEVDIKISDMGAAGAGILIGLNDLSSPDLKQLIFTINSNGQFTVALKRNNGLSVLGTSQNKLININGTNKLAVRSEINGLVFSINDSEAFLIPKATIRDPQNYVGIVAFGKGTFTFHQVTIRQNLPPMRVSAPTRVPPVEKKACSLPAPKKDDQIIILGAYEGKAISSVALGDVYEETSSGEIIIEEGDKPIYLVIYSFDPMIWRFKGATSRLSNVVLIASQSYKDIPVIGATGIKKDIITIRNETPKDTLPCGKRFSDEISTEGVQAKAILQKLLNRDADILKGFYGVDTVSIPSLTLSMNNQVGGGSVPAGVAYIDETKVMSDVKAIPYEILPQRFGLSQLVGSGALEVTSDRRYKIIKPISYFPAGLYGGHSVNFILGKGVPMPAGDLGHSRIISEEFLELIASGSIVILKDGGYKIVKPIQSFPATLERRGAGTFILGKGIPLPANMPKNSKIISEETGEEIKHRHVIIVD